MKKAKLKIRDLSKNINLGNVIIKTPCGKVGKWKSQWDKGVWLKEDEKSNKITPIFVENLQECLDWEVVKI